MASKVIYECDRCHTEVGSTSDLFIVGFKHVNGSMVITLTGDDRNPELCRNCLQLVMKIIQEDWPDIPDSVDAQEIANRVMGNEGGEAL